MEKNDIQCSEGDCRNPVFVTHGEDQKRMDLGIFIACSKECADKSDGYHVLTLKEFRSRINISVNSEFMS